MDTSTSPGATNSPVQGQDEEIDSNVEPHVQLNISVPRSLKIALRDLAIRESDAGRPTHMQDIAIAGIRAEIESRNL